MNLIDWVYLLLSNLVTVQVRVNEGILEGKVMVNPYGNPYFSFKGIPYAEPPLGELRFKAPQPKTPWDGIRDAKEHASKCYHYEPFTKDTRLLGSEDCLYLNVYTPNIAPENPLPVMVWIHGGGFYSGSGNDDEQGPEFLIRKEVIIVTLNYRLEVLGFLSLDTEEVPGNAGMKDQVAALRWVKMNIRAFGGNPNNITIFGESAGGVSVSLHLVSPMSKGLFHRAIIQSGTLTCWWPFPFRARDRALQLAKELGCNSTNDKEIYDFLKNQPVENLVRRHIKITYVQWSKESPNIYFGIVSESQFGDSERFFYGDPYDVLRNGIHEDVEIMNGYNQDEGLMYFSTEVEAERLFYQANKYLEFFAPGFYTVRTPVANQMKLGSNFKTFYMANKTVSKDTIDDLLKYLDMNIIVYGAMSLQQIIAKNRNVKNYMYKFTCSSELNFYTHLSKLHMLFDYRPMIAHSDDCAYIFSRLREGEVIDMQSTTFKMIEQVTTLWTNFAKFGDPTPDDSLGVKWLPYTLEQQDYLNIGEHLVESNFPENETIEFWINNFQQYLPELVP